jgi:hypothetical protein
MGIILLGTGLVRLEPVVAQEPATGQQAVVSTDVDRAQLETYVRVMKGELERAEARAKAVTDQLVSLDADIESRMNHIVSLLSSVRDSADGPGSRMRKAKEEALAGLKASAVYYAQQRDLRKKEMGNSLARIDDEALARDVAALNARIEMRVAQSLDIAASLAQQEEDRVERYQNADTDYSNETREFRKVQRDARASVKVKTDLAAVLRASIEKLSRDVKAREDDLKMTADPQRQAQLTEDIKTMRQTIAVRRGQIEELLAAPKPSTRPVGGKAAFEMDKMLNEMAVELRSDFAKFKHLVSERDTARARLKPLKERLEKATAMLQMKQPSNQSVNNP